MGAPHGTPVYAVRIGTLWYWSTGDVGGSSVYLMRLPTLVAAGGAFEGPIAGMPDTSAVVRGRSSSHRRTRRACA